MAHQIPEEVIELILSFAPDYHDNLLSCHKEMLTDHRPMYYKKVSVGFAPGITDTRDWDNFKRNEEITLWRRGTFNLAGPMVFMKLKLYAVEITPEKILPNDEKGCWRHYRHINLYYGWSKHATDIFWETIREWGQYENDLCPGYY